MNTPSAANPLLDCLYFESDPVKSDRLAGFTPADWQTAVRDAQRHGLAPYLYWRLLQLPAHPAVPAPLWDELHASLYTSASRNTRLFHQLGEVINVLQEAAVAAIVLKGVHLAALVYDDNALRPMGDIDLLVRKKHLARAAACLSGLGYQPSNSYQIELLIRRHHHLPSYTRSGAQSIELHWNLTPPGAPFQVDLEYIWRRAVSTHIAGGPALTLSPSDLLVHNCAHLCNHEFRLSLRALLDIGLILARYQNRLDWDAIKRQARGQGDKCLYLALYLANEMLAAPLPLDLLPSLQPSSCNPEIKSLARRRLLAFGTPPDLHPDLACILAGRRPLSARLQKLSAILLRPPEHIANRYGLPPGSRRVYPYYLLHLKNLFLRYGHQLWGLLRRRPAVTVQAAHQNDLGEWLASK